MQDHSFKEGIEEPRSWAMREARKVLERIQKYPSQKGYVVFETGYGPSGLPHIGTYCGVVRTKMVQNSLAMLTDFPSKLFVVSDDMDGMRRDSRQRPKRKNARAVYANATDRDVPDPFEKCDSYGHYMNAQLRAFLDELGFEYEFKSATDLYKKERRA